MPNIFLLYMPPGNAEAMIHYEHTIRQGVSLERISRYLSAEMVRKLRDLFGDRPIAVWGSRDGRSNRRNFDQMNDRDNILIVEGHSIRLMGLIAAKVVSPELSRELWLDVGGQRTRYGLGSDLLYCQPARNQSSVRTVLQASRVSRAFAATRIHLGIG
jgi:hypothetical protein